MQGSDVEKFIESNGVVTELVEEVNFGIRPDRDKCLV